MTEGAGNEKIKDAPLNILLVEDSESDSKIALRAFNRAALKNNIYVVNDGQECLDYVRSVGRYQDKEKYPTPDLILLDINLPKINGFGVLQNLKNDENYKYIPIIVLSASKNEEDIMKSYSNGANSFIQKPVDYEYFIKVIDGFNFYWHTANKLPGTRR